MRSGRGRVRAPLTCRPGAPVNFRRRALLLLLLLRSDQRAVGDPEPASDPPLGPRGARAAATRPPRAVVLMRGRVRRPALREEAGSRGAAVPRGGSGAAEARVRVGGSFV